MKSRISELLEEIRAREEELEDAIKTHEVEFLYRLEGSKIKFEQAVEQAHRKLKVGVFQWLRKSNPLNVLSSPVIYSCFPLYKIQKVDRKKYIVVDRQHLSYLNSIEKLNCMYCGYINGLISYSREIVARTEQYWCPIKHAKKVLGPHQRYAHFADFGDPKDRRQHVAKMRDLLPKAFIK